MNDFRKKIAKLIFKKELILYVVVGILTTVVNFSIYIFFTRIIKTSIFISNIIAWFIAAIFAFFMNKHLVFKSTKKEFLKELISFFILRLNSGVFEVLALMVSVQFLKLNDLIAKAVISIVVVILNYIFSKKLIFKKKEK